MGKKMGSTVSTKEKILAAAQDEFNKRGIGAVALHKIAAMLDISPGNLTYHFRRKEDLVFELVSWLEGQLVSALHDVDHVMERGTIEQDADEVATKMVEVVELLWEHRFFFNGIQFVRESEDLLGLFLKFESLIISAQRNAFEEAIKRGNMRPIRAPNSTQLAAENVWSIWLTWMSRSNLDNAKAVQDAYFVRGMIDHYFSLIEPYCSEDFAKTLYKKISEKNEVELHADDPRATLVGLHSL